MRNNFDYDESKQKSEWELEFEKEMLEKLFLQDKHAYSIFYKRYYKNIEVAIFFKIRDIEDAKDITSEAFLRLWENLQKMNPKTFKGVPSLAGYVHRMAINMAIDFLRKNKGTTSLSKDVIEDTAEEHDMILIIFSTEIYIKLEEALRQLKERERDVYFMYYRQNVSLKEIAEILNVTVPNANKIKFRTDQKILSYLKKAIGFSILIKALLFMLNEIRHIFLIILQR
jgi:RNA polymerase sigma factor (sigma-70 family)